MLKITKYLLLILFISRIVGCASYTDTISKTYESSPKMAYVYGRFTKSGLPNFVLVFEDIARSRQYAFKFSNKNKLALVEVMPGEYEITHFTAANAFGELIGKKPLSGWPYRISFIVEAGTTYYLGDFTASYSHSGQWMRWTIEDYVDSYDSANKELDKSYKRLSILPKARAFDSSGIR